MDLTRKISFLRDAHGSSSIIWDWHQVWPYTSVEKESKLNVRKILGLAPTFVEVTGNTLVGVGGFFLNLILDIANT